MHKQLPTPEEALAALKKQPKVVGTPVALTPAQQAKAVTYLTAHWGKI